MTKSMCQSFLLHLKIMVLFCHQFQVDILHRYYEKVFYYNFELKQFIFHSIQHKLRHIAPTITLFHLMNQFLKHRLLQLLQLTNQITFHRQTMILLKKVFRNLLQRKTSTLLLLPASFQISGILRKKTPKILFFSSINFWYLALLIYQ